ncbi:MAG TPA: ADP-forming succinate--CoA ligase subunit beta [Iamia sp.]|nr:ADP-forming succinate--CoA ligase subunit beta [Iamia sp.]
MRHGAGLPGIQAADPSCHLRERRRMDLFEYQGKQFFASYDIPVSPGDVATTVDDAVAVAERIADYPVVVKAQVQVGGRGKAGGIKLAGDADEVREHATNILGMDIKGHTVERIWIEHASDIAEEYYASFTLDRSAKKHLGMLSAQGGVEIEAVAESDPDAIAKIWIDPVDGLTEDVAREWVAAAKLNPDATEGAVDILLKLYRAYVEGDADLVEINPLILTPEGKVHALDAKVTLDGNAAFRHDYAEYEATQERDEREQAAHDKDLQYVGLDGTVGVIANGAGLAMSTVDIINQVGGSPANFLDIGGGANADVMAGALEVITGDPNVKSIFINIFGGITKGDEVANGIVQALGRVDITVPMVIRLDGTNAEEGRRIIEEQAAEKVQSEPTMLEAAKAAVELAK